MIMFMQHVEFRAMSEMALRQWVQDNPYRITFYDKNLDKVIDAASEAGHKDLVTHLIDMGVDPMRTLRNTWSIRAINTLFSCGVDPTRMTRGETPFMVHAKIGRVRCLERLLEDPRVRSGVNATSVGDGNTALHLACSTDTYSYMNSTTRQRVIKLLLDAGANPTLTNANGQTPSDVLDTRPCNREARFVLRDKTWDQERSAYLIKVRRLVVAVAGGGKIITSRQMQGQPLPHVELSPSKRKKHHKAQVLRTTLAFLVDLGPKHMPTGVFVTIMDMLMPVWDPMR